MPHSHLTEDPLVLLAKDVCKSAGFEVTCTRDCEILSDELRSFDGRFPISVSTLRRFFGLIPKQSAFSLTTLNSLARYVGYPSYQKWEAAQKTPQTETKPHLETSRKEVSQFVSAPDQPAEYSSPVGFKPPSQWSEAEAKQRIARFIERFSNPEDFHLTTQEFARLKEAVFHLYEKGTFDMALWLKFIEHQHLLRFVVEQFPPLDYLSTFGRAIMSTYLRIAESPTDVMFGQGVMAAGMVAQDANWGDVLPLLTSPEALNPSIHPLVQSRNLGLWLLAGRDKAIPEEALLNVRSFILDGLKRDEQIWPRWANQNCYFAFNLADWGILSEDREIVAAITDNIESFKKRADWYQRDVAMDTMLSLRLVWNHLFLGDKTKAKIIAQQFQWSEFRSMETRTLGMWYHSALQILQLAPAPVCRANVQHCATLTGYSGFERRIGLLTEGL